MTPEPDGQEWMRTQIDEFGHRREAYAQFAESLGSVLRAAAQKRAPQAIVQARAKTIPSFTEKIQRKRQELPDPVNQLTDLCGARVITLTQADVDAMCQFIEAHFVVDWDNSVDITDRHRASEFGYRSRHYIVSFKPGVFPTRDVPIDVPESLLPGSTPQHLPNARAEIQVRTLLEHAWAAISHDLVYKAGFKVPPAIEREFAATAALLESADRSFSSSIQRLSEYRSSRGSYQTADQLREEIELLSFVRTQSPDDTELAERIAALASALGAWQEAIDALEPHARVAQPEPSVLRDLGVALCSRDADTPDSSDYLRGRTLIEQTLELAPTDAAALEALARTWDRVDDDLARDLHRRAYQADPDDPYTLAAYLRAHIAFERELAVCGAMTPSIRQAVQRCAEHAAVQINLPDALLTAGFLRLLLGEPYEAIDVYSRGVMLAQSPHPLRSALDSLLTLKTVGPEIEGWEWSRRLLLLALTTRFGDLDALERVRQLASPDGRELKEPVAILGGGTSAEAEAVVAAHEGLLRSAFSTYCGTLISGGTQEGVCGIAARIRNEIGSAVLLVGYVPRLIPSGATLAADSYDVIHRTDGAGFSPLEPLQDWIDIAASGINPADVRLVGINGGAEAAAEYRIALALGASVALIEGSGRAASLLLGSRDWVEARGLVPMPHDVATLRHFIDHRSTTTLDPSIRETLARDAHEAYVVESRARASAEDPALRPWDSLDETLRHSNRAQADDIARKMHLIGCEVVPADSPLPDNFEGFTQAEIELLAEEEHGRWNTERLLSGWRRGAERSVERQTNPSLVSWEQLSENAREWDRQAVRSIPGRLANVGLRLVRFA